MLPLYFERLHKWIVLRGLVHKTPFNLQKKQPFLHLFCARRKWQERNRCSLAFQARKQFSTCKAWSSHILIIFYVREREEKNVLSRLPTLILFSLLIPWLTLIATRGHIHCLPCSVTHSLIYFFTFVPVRRWGMVVCDCRLYWILFVRKTLRWKFNYMKVMVSSVRILVFQSTLMSNYLEAKVPYAFWILKTKFGLVLTKARIR